MAKIFGIVGILALVLVLPVTIFVLGQGTGGAKRASDDNQLETQGFIAADSFVDSDTPKKNFGGEPVLWADGVSKKISYIKLNLQSLAGKNIESAKLNMFVVYPSKQPVEVKFVPVSTWVSNTITYAARPLPSKTVIARFSGGSSGEWMEVDVTDFVRENAGKVVTIALETTDPGGLSFNSVESPFNKLELVVDEAK